MNPRLLFRNNALRNLPPTAWGLAAVLAGLLWIAFFSAKSSGPLKWSFPAAGVRAVRIRASYASRAHVRYAPGASTIEIAARPSLSPNGYHAPELTGKETPASSWKFDFAPSLKDGVLELCSQGETRLQRCRYSLRSIEVVAPAGVTVTCEDADSPK